jgi:hypothetical protein
MVGKSIPRWDPRSRIRLYLGPSPLHARNVHLVLSLITGLVSPQFHCHFDNFFETCTYGVSDMGISSTWQHLAGFKRANGDPWIQPDQRLLSCAPISKMGNTSKSQLPTAKFLPSKPQHEQSVSSEFFNDEDVDGTKPWSNVEQPSQESRIKPRRDSQPQDFVTYQETFVGAGTSTQGRARRMTRAMAESVSQQDFYGQSQMHYMASSATGFVTGQTDEDCKHDDHLALQECMRHPIAFHAEMMGDIMYLNQALQQPDAAHFVEAVVQEVNGHVDNNHWQLTKCSKAPSDVKVVPSVWSLRCKRDITTNKIKKYTARPNLHRGKQVFGLNYYETYALVVTWF